MPELPNKDFALSLDQIQALITDVAVHGEGADKLRALKMLQAEKTTEAILPDPLNDNEVADRIERILRGAGRTITNQAIAKFFSKKTAKSPEKVVKDLQAEDLNIEVDKLPRTLKSFYRKYPEMKGPGFPTGYPAGKGPFAQMEWCRKASVQVEVQRARANQLDAIRDIKGIEGMDAPAPSGEPVTQPAADV